MTELASVFTTSDEALRTSMLTPLTQMGVFEVAKRQVGGKVIYVDPAGNDSSDGRSWQTAKATIAAAITLLTSGGCIFVAGQHTISSALPEPAQNTLIIGDGPDTRITYTGTGAMLTITGKRQIHIKRIRISLTNASASICIYNNCFSCSFDSCLLDGLHVSTATTYHTQIGIQYRNNSGDCRLINCDFNNLGEIIQSDTIMNYAIGCRFGNSWRHFNVDAGASTGGFSFDNCTFVSTAIGAAACETVIKVSVPANQIWITNCWIEGCLTAVELGTNTGTVGGPFGGGIFNTRIAATNFCLNIKAGRQFRLDNVTFGADSGATPVELQIDATNAPDGFASNLISHSGYDIAHTVFPAGWTYFPRSQSDAQISSPNVRIGQGLSNGQPSYFYTANGRTRIGYDGTRTILSDAGGGRDVAIISGLSPSNVRQLITAASDGMVHLGNGKTTTVGGAVGGVAIKEVVTAPTSAPTGGAVLYVEGGAPKVMGTNGKVLKIASSVPILSTANYTAQSGDYILANTSAGVFTITLPASPSAGDTVRVVGNSWSTNNLTIARNGQTIDSVADDLLCTFDSDLTFIFVGGTWSY